MKRSVLRALQGLVLSIGSPIGWLLIQAYRGDNALLNLQYHPGVYIYMLLATAVVFSGFGWYVGRQEEHFRESSLNDALTGLYNRRYFWRRLEDERAFATRHQRPLALLIGDLDLFKKVNDTYGHSAGDDVLRAVGAALMSLRRRGDTIARVGGEEFAVILPDTGLDEAIPVAERLRKAVAELQFQPDQDSKRPFGVTLSFGAVCEIPHAKLKASALYKRADQAMYQAKREGRDRVVALGAGTPAAGGAKVSPS